MQSILMASSGNLSAQMPTQFEVHTHALVGVEALWEIVLAAPSKEIYEKSLSFILKLYTQLN